MNGNKLATRKFILASVTLAASWILVAADKVSGAELVTLDTFTLGLFFGANVWAKHKSFTESQ